LSVLRKSQLADDTDHSSSPFSRARSDSMFSWARQARSRALTPSCARHPAGVRSFRLGCFAIDLKPSDPQAWHSVPIQITLPLGEFLGRYVIAGASFLYTNAPFANCQNDCRLSFCYPPFDAGRRQISVIHTRMAYVLGLKLQLTGGVRSSPLRPPRDQRMLIVALKTP
jgi:hypothetical protein